MVLFSIPACCRSHDSIKRLYITQIQCKINILLFTNHISHRISNMLFFNFTNHTNHWQSPSGHWKRHYNAIRPDFTLENTTRREMADIYGIIWFDYWNSSGTWFIYRRICNNILRLESTFLIFHSCHNNPFGFRHILRKGQYSYRRLSSRLFVRHIVSDWMCRSDVWIYKRCRLWIYTLSGNFADNHRNYIPNIICKASAKIGQTSD